MFFIHGWPDNKEIWLKQFEHFHKKYHCICLDLPHLGSESIKDISPFGYNLQEWMIMCTDTLITSMKACGQENEKVILVIHDWGSVIGSLIQRKSPELIKKMVVLDVWMDPKEEIQFKGLFF